VSGRRILFVNPMHTHGFVGMRREEAWPVSPQMRGSNSKPLFKTRPVAIAMANGEVHVLAGEIHVMEGRVGTTSSCQRWQMN
jgi:hypothetical protein